MDDLNELGAGVTLYFRIVKYLAVVFVCLTLVSLPALGLLAGSARLKLFDFFQFSRMSLANAGPVRGVSLLPRRPATCSTVAVVACDS
jgi:hypothetical protein